MPATIAQFPEIKDTLPCGAYNEAELTFIKEHSGETPYKAFSEDSTFAERFGLKKETIHYQGKRGKQMPHVNDEVQSFRETVEPALQRIFDLVDTDDPDFVGLDAVREGIDKAIQYERAYRKEKERSGRGWHPSMYTRDSKGNRFYQGRGSDSGRVQITDVALLSSAKDATDRRDFTVDVFGEFEGDPVEVSSEDVAEDFTATMDEVPTELKEGEDYWGCTVCSFRKQYDPASTTARNRARQGVLMHMMRTKEEKDAHREHYSVISRQ